VALTLGIDVACRTAHQASLAGSEGLVWTGRKFHTAPADLERLWRDLDLDDPAQLTVVMEPTRNAWAPLASWFRRRGATVCLIPTTQAADLRAYYSKHTKNDRLDSTILARLPLLHPEGLREYVGDGPADPLRRMTRQRASLVKRRTAVLTRLDALLELLGPAWHEALGTRFGKTTLKLLSSHYADPTRIRRLGRSRLTQFLIRHSNGAWREDRADLLLAAADQSLQLWGQDGLDFTDLAVSIAVEAEQAQALAEQVDTLDERIAAHYQRADPDRIIASAPGIGAVTAGIIAGRIGDPHRFTSLAAVRAYSGLVPRTNQSGLSDRPGGLTKAGDALLREAVFNAADKARKTDPQLAAKYARLMHQGNHHNCALCHVAATLLTRILACWRSGEHYVIRDTGGRPLSPAEGRHLVATSHKVDPDIRATAKRRRRAQAQKGRTGQVQQESHSAPASRPASTTINTAATT
jgi:transposase